MTTNLTTFIFNLTFSSEHLIFFNTVHLEIKEGGILMDNYKNFKKEFNKIDDKQILHDSLISRTYHAQIEDINFGSVKFKFILDKNKSYETNFLSYKPSLINIFYNLDFKSSKNKNDCFITHIFLTTRLYEFCRIIIWMKSQVGVCSDYAFQKIMEKDCIQTFDKISDSDSSEDKIILLNLIIIYLDDFQLNYVFKKLENFKWNSKEIYEMREDTRLIETIEMLINKLKNFKSYKNNILFFIMNMWFLQENFHKISTLNLSYDNYVDKAFSNLILMKEHYNINQKEFQILQNSLNQYFDRKTFILLFSLIKNDEELLLCLNQSWRPFFNNNENNLSNNFHKINATDIIIYLKKKNLHVAEHIFEKIENNLEITNGTKLNTEPNNEILFSKTFYFNIDQTLIIFLEHANDVHYLNFLLKKAYKYKELKYLNNEQTIFKINEKIENFILDKFKNSKDSIDSLKVFLELQKVFALNVNNVLKSSKELYRKEIENYLKKMFKFSDNKFKLEEELKLYREINFLEILNYENFIDILKENEKKLDFRQFFQIYNKERIKFLFGLNNHFIKMMIIFLFEKIINTEKSVLLKYKVNYIEFLNDLISSWKEEEKNIINLKDLINNNLLEKQFQKLDLNSIFEIYIGDNLFDKINDYILSLLTDFLVVKIKESNLEELIKTLKQIYRINPNINKKNKNLIGKVLEISMQNLPSKDLFLKEGIDPKIELYYQIFEFIKKFQNAKENLKNFEEPINTNESENEINLTESHFIEENINNLNVEKINSYNSIYEKMFDRKISLFEEFFKLINELNKNIFKNEMCVSDYIFLKGMVYFEKNRKFYLLGLLYNDFEIYKKHVTNKLEEVQAKKQITDNIKEFLNFYFKNVGDNNKSLECFINKSSNIKKLKYN